MKRLYGQLDMIKKSGEISDLFVKAENGEYFSDSFMTIACIGRIYSLDNNYLSPPTIISINDIHQLYTKYGLNFTKYIDGMFTIFILDKKTDRAFIFQGGSFNPLDLYYTIHNNMFFFSTSLKKLLRMSAVKRTLNYRKIDLFLTNGFIPCKETLIENVYKLTPGRFLSLDIRNGNLRMNIYKKSERTITKKFAEENYYNILKNIIISKLNHAAEIKVCLSSGYDSNLMLHLIREVSDKKITAYSIGSISADDESSISEEICKFYDNVFSRTAKVSYQTLCNFPDIVWRLEGAIYERGIFLQYELAKLVCDTPGTLFCGECCDQILHINLDPSVRKILPKRLRWQKNPFEMAAFAVIKKNGIMTNSFSIDVEYPYISQNFADVGKVLKYINKDTKEFHKQVVKKNINRNIYGLLSKKSGSTYLSALFNNYAQFVRIAEKTSNTWVRKYICDGYKDPAYNENEQLKDLYIKLLYLFLFDELFISGKYDDYYEEVTIPLTTEDFLK